MLKPLGSRALVKPLEAEEKSAGGIILPEAAQERPREGKVVAVGTVGLYADEESEKPGVKKGDIVIYARNVVLEKKWGAPTMTKDGVTVAKEVELEDEYENMGAQLCKEVASKTNDDTGDGTTTAAVLAQGIVKAGIKNVAAGANPMLIKKGIEEAVKDVVAFIRESAIPVEGRDDIAHVAGIAGNDPEIGEYIADAMEKVGKDGVITVEESKVGTTTVDVVEGMQFDKGYISPYFAMEDTETQLEDPYILLYEEKISSATDIVPIMEKVAGTGKPLLVIAENVEAEALATLVVNNMRGTVRACAVKAPGFGDRRKRNMEDLAVLTAGRFISEDLGIKLDGVQLEDMGRAERVLVTKDETTLIQGAGTAREIDGRVKEIRREIEDTDSDYDREKLEERLAKLAGGVAVIKVGAATETELKELQHRFEDALSSARSAIEEGIVPGGGVTLLRATKLLDKTRDRVRGDAKVGVEIVRRALSEPLRWIAQNAGYEGSVVANRVLSEDTPSFGFNALTEEYEDLLEGGITDPAKVVRSALENATSIGALVLTTEALVAEIPEPEPPMPPPGGDMGGNMGMM